MTTEHWGSGDAASFVEAIHRVDLGDEAWLDGMTAALHALVPGAMFLIGSVASWRNGVVGLQMEAVRGTSPSTHEAILAGSSGVAPTFATDFFGGGGRVTLVSEAFRRGASSPPLAEIMRNHGVNDLLSLTAVVPTLEGGRGASVAVLSAETIRLTPEHRSILDGYGAHVAAAYRLRTAGLGGAVEGVLAPDGHVLHAEGEAQGELAREALKRAVLAVERARRVERRTDAASLLEAWRAIYERRWTLVETIESDGKRIFVARVNPPREHVDAALSPREQQVAALLAEGVPQKAIGYELELSPSTVAFHASNIARKLGARSITDAVRMMAGSTRHRPRDA